jgi:hypothetical protein
LSLNSEPQDDLFGEQHWDGEESKDNSSEIELPIKIDTAEFEILLAESLRDQGVEGAVEGHA